MTDRAAPPPLDELLARREWVRRFARTLARDDASADDLAQDAWLAAIERPPAHAAAPAGWLRRVLLHRAMNRTRGERRRGAHENAASRRDTSPAAADVVAAAESHRRVVEAVMALEEPYRTTILLRFFEDLPPREVAARMGVPVETVRARVRRAVEKLRKRLDDEHDGHRAAWLGPLVGADRPRAAPDAGLTTGALVMTTTKKAVLAAAILLLLGAGALVVARSRARDAGEQVATAAATDTRVAATRRPRARVPTTPPDDDRAAAPAVQPPAPAAEPTQDAPPPHDFVVVVHDTQGAPVPGVRVRLEVGRDGARSLTDESGRAKFSGLRADVRSASADHEAADGHAWRQRGAVRRVRPGASEVELVVERWEPVRGRVIGDDGEPVRDAEVFAVADGRRVAEAVSDDGGKFRLAVPSGAAYDVALSGRIGHASMRPASDELTATARGVAPGGDEVVLVARPAAGRLAVRVRAVTADGRPLADVPIGVTTPSSWWPLSREAITGPDGRVAFEDVPDRLVRVNVEVPTGETPAWERDGWITPPWERFAPAGGGELTLVFESGKPIRGRVRFPDGYPSSPVPGVPGPRAIVVLDDEDRVTLSRAWSDYDGLFTVLAPAAARGPFHLSTGMSDEKRRSFEAQADDVPADAQDVVLRIVETTR